MRVAMLLLLPLLHACGGGGGDATGPSGIAGTYLLHNVDGDPVPSLLVEMPGYTLEVTSANVALNANGTFTDSFTLREDDGGTITTVTIPCTGQWTRSGDTVVLRESGSSDCTFVGRAVWSGNTLTVDWEESGVDFEYRR